MTRRGRPAHPDVLTPRQWQVLALLREGLSNEQIALRLGISVDGVKFHVSEILGKLGVDSRNEAAQWEGEQRQATPSACVGASRRRPIRLAVHVACSGRKLPAHYPSQITRRHAHAHPIRHRNQRTRRAGLRHLLATAA